MKAKKGKSQRFMSSVKVGPKGQIVIPKEVRQMFEIAPGDTLILLADSSRGIALERYGVFQQVADAIFAGKAKEVYPDKPEADSLRFAQALREISDKGELVDSEEEQDG